MVEGPKSDVVFYVAAIFFSLFVGQWILEYFALRADWCEAAQVSCLREWIAATSGWAAAFAALITILFLRRQIFDQRRQTDYVVGDAPPAIDAVQHFTDQQEVVVRITNLNRRSVLIMEVDFSSQAAAGVIEIERTAENFTEKVASGIEPYFRPPLALKGWTDRSKAPPMMKFIVAGVNEDGELVDRWDPGVEVHAKVRMIGERSSDRVLVGEITPVPR